MRRIIHAFLILTVIAWGAMSCSKEPYPQDDYYYWLYGGGEADGGSGHQGDGKKVDIKGSLMNGDMKHPNIQAWLIENTLYVQFNETIENCMVLVFTSSGRVVYSRQVETQYPGAVRVYMGNKPSGDYRLYLTNGYQEAEGWFSYEKQ
ncbi:MAG: DUF3244 domain-containing protein [Bacteroidales bacterium]|nr:DUF3244 domain-containing protein [Bacteroidales bacterium]